MNIKKCCSNCTLCKRLELVDSHDKNKVIYETYDGYACLLFINDGVIRHLRGFNPDIKTCEYFTPKIEFKNKSDSKFVYKNYKGTIIYDPDLRCYSGKIVDGWGEYYGCTLDELYRNFIKQVDKYINWCETIISYPERKDAWGRRGIKIIKDGELYKCIKLKDIK